MLDKVNQMPMWKCVYSLITSKALVTYILLIGSFRVAWSDIEKKTTEVRNESLTGEALFALKQAKTTKTDLRSLRISHLVFFVQPGGIHFNL